MATWTIGPVPARKDGKPPKVKVQVSLNLHGLVVLQSAVVVEEEEYEEVVRKPLAKVRLLRRTSAVFSRVRSLGLTTMSALHWEEQHGCCKSGNLLSPEFLVAAGT